MSTQQRAGAAAPAGYELRLLPAGEGRWGAWVACDEITARDLMAEPVRAAGLYQVRECRDSERAHASGEPTASGEVGNGSFGEGGKAAVAPSYSYSLCGESYTGRFASVDEALAIFLREYPEGGAVWVGEVSEHDPSHFVSASYLLESVADNAYSECGDCVESWTDRLSSRELIDELEDVICEWLRKRAPITFWSVENPLLHHVSPTHREALEASVRLNEGTVTDAQDASTAQLSSASPDAEEHP